MPQARRRKPSRAKPSRGQWSGVATFIAGIIAGALGVLILQGAGIRELIDGAQRTSRDAPRTAQSQTQSQSQSKAPPSDAAPSPTKLRTDFSFFTVLPEIEITAPHSPPEIERSKTAPSDGGARTAFMLQAGSFSKHFDADKLKVRLAFHGFASKIQKITIQGRGDFYRVRLGPYSSYSAMVDADRELQKIDIKTLRLKMVDSR